VRVAVEVVPGGGFRAKCDMMTPVDIRNLAGTTLEAPGIEVACMSAARYARHLFPPWDAWVVIREVSGRCASVSDAADGLAVATVLAIGRALGREGAIPVEAFRGVTCSWEPLPNANERGE
jgi:hypothetical protein